MNAGLHPERMDVIINPPMSAVLLLVILNWVFRDSINESSAMVAKLKEKNIVTIWKGSMEPRRLIVSRVGMVLPKTVGF